MLKVTIDLLLVYLATSAFTLSFPNGTSFSDPYTLTPAVTYALNITFQTNDIAAASTVTIQFGYRYNITAATLNNCLYSTSAAALTSSSCTAS